MLFLPITATKAYFSHDGKYALQIDMSKHGGEQYKLYNVAKKIMIASVWPNGNIRKLTKK